MVSYTEKEVNFRIQEKNLRSQETERRKYDKSLKVEKDVILHKQRALDDRLQQKRKLELSIKKLYLVLQDRSQEESQEGIKLSQLSQHFVKKLEAELEQGMERLKNNQSEEIRL